MVPWFVWAAAATGLACLWRRRPDLIAMAGLGLWCLVPGLAVSQLSSPVVGEIVLHPATWLVGAGLAFTAVTRGPHLAAAVTAQLEVIIVLVLVCAVATWLSLAPGAGTGPLADSLDRFWAPFALVLLIGTACEQDPAAAPRLVRWFLAMAAVQAVAALAEYLLGTPLLYANRYSDQVWFGSVAGRWMGTLDHPLVLSLMMVGAVPLLAGLRRWTPVVLLVPLLAAGTLLTQSRTGLALAIVGACFVALGPRRSALARIVLAAALLGAGVLLLRSALVEGVAERIDDDTGSTQARVDATTFFREHLAEYLWLGKGLDANYQVAGSAGLQTSLENSFFQLSVDLGLVVTSAYYLAMLGCVLRRAGRGTWPGLSLAAAAAAVVTLGFSGLAATTATQFVLWYLLALAGYQGRAAARAKVLARGPRQRPRREAATLARPGAGPADGGRAQLT